MGSAVFSLRNAGSARETAAEVEKRQRCSYAKRLCSYTAQLGWVKQVQISSRSYSKHRFNRGFRRSFRITISKRSGTGVSVSPQKTEMCAQTEDGTWVSYPPAVQLRFFFLSLPRKLSILSRFAAQDPRPRNGEACFTAAKANRKERHLWQDQPQRALHCWPTQGSRHLRQHQPLLRWVPGALCTLQDEAPLLTPQHPASESYTDDSVTEQQWYFHTQGKTLNAW